MTKSAIIVKAQLYLDDTSELSDAEFSDLFDTKLKEVSSRKVWEALKREGTGTTSTSVPYVTLPTGFRFLLANANHTESSYASERPVVYVGTTYDPYQVVSWSDRRSYREKNGYAYIDYPNSRLVFTKQPTEALPVEFDYYLAADGINMNEEPWIPAEFQPILFHEMVIDDFIIQQSDKARSYAPENKSRADQYYANMCYWNASLVQS